jgi:hypothetical protein
LDDITDQYPVLSFIFYNGQLPVAFQKGMTIEVGRDAIKALLSAACLPAVGAYKTVQVIGVGSSCAPHESFPVRKVGSVRQSVSLPYDLGSPSTSSNVPSSGTSDNASENEYASNSDPGDLFYMGEIYTDVMVITSHKPSWARCIFVSEIKSEALNDNHREQLMWQMLAPLIDQNFCFGLLINEKEANLYCMERDPVCRQIYYSSRYYNFVEHVANEADQIAYTKFCFLALKSLFSDIVVSLHYSKHNIKQCVANH